MYVCYCRAVTDRTILAHIAEGAGDERQLAERCGAGVRCGGCLPAVRQLLSEMSDAPADNCAA